MWQWVARGNIQQISYIPQTEQHSPFGLMLLCLGNVTIMCVCVCMCVCMHVCVCMYVCMYEEEGYLLPTIARKITCRRFD